MNPEKTDSGILVSSFGCSDNPQEAAKMFQQVRAAWNSRSTVLCQHVIQSFKPDEITPELVHQIGMELAERLLGEEYQFVLATHTDKAHIHNHLIFCNVNMMNGKSFETLQNKGSKKSWKTLRQISDKLCEEHGLSVIQNPEQNKGKSHYEWDMNRQGLSWKTKLRHMIDDCIMKSADFEDFLKKCAESGIEAVYAPEKKISLKFRMEGQQRFTRAKTLGWYYEPKQISDRIKMFHQITINQTKIIDTAQERISQSGGLTRWAEIQNMKEASRVLNILSRYQAENQEQLGAIANCEYAKRMKLVADLNDIQHQLSENEELTEIVRTYQKYKPIHEEYQELKWTFSKKRYAKQHTDELEKFRNAKNELKQRFPDKNVPSVNYLEKQRKSLIEQRQDKNASYQEAKAKIKELEYCRQTITDYLRNEQAQQKKKNRNILE